MRTAITCVALVALLVLTGCSSCDDCKSCTVPSELVGKDHDYAHWAVVEAHLQPSCGAGWDKYPVIKVWPPSGTMLTCGEVVHLTYGTVIPTSLKETIPPSPPPPPPAPQ